MADLYMEGYKEPGAAVALFPAIVSMLFPELGIENSITTLSRVKGHASVILENPVGVDSTTIHSWRDGGWNVSWREDEKRSNRRFSISWHTSGLLLVSGWLDESHPMYKTWQKIAELLE